MVLQYLYTLYARCPFPEVGKRNIALLVTSVYSSHLGLYSWRFNNIVHSLLFFWYNITLIYPKPSSSSVAKYWFLLNKLFLACLVCLNLVILLHPLVWHHFLWSLHIGMVQLYLFLKICIFKTFLKHPWKHLVSVISTCPYFSSAIISFFPWSTNFYDYVQFSNAVSASYSILSFNNPFALQY